MAKPKNKNIPWPILGIIYACLLFAMYVSLSTLVLGFWGQTTVGTTDSYESRLDNRNAGENRSRTVSKGYHFTVNGKSYRGYVIYLSDESWPRLSKGETRAERISYLAIFPYINKPSDLVEFDELGALAIAHHSLAPFGYLFLLFLVAGTVKNQKKKAISIRVNENDIYELKKKALENSIPYQNLIQILIHQFATNKIHLNM